MSASNGVCLHQIIGELERIEKSIVMNIEIVDNANSDAGCFLRQHLEEVHALIVNIESI